MLLPAITDATGAARRSRLHTILNVIAGLLIVVTIGVVGVGLLITRDGTAGDASRSPLAQRVATYPSRVCRALPAVDEIESEALPRYFDLIELGDGDRVHDRHYEMVDDMLAISRGIFQESADESEFGELELAIGDWMQHLDAAMTTIDVAYRTGDDAFRTDAARDFSIAQADWNRVEALRASLAC